MVADEGLFDIERRAAGIETISINPLNDDTAVRPDSAADFPTDPRGACGDFAMGIAA